MNDRERWRYFPTVNADLLGETLGSWQAKFPDMGVCAFLPEAQKGQVSLLQSACARLQIPLVGAIFPALLHRVFFIPRMAAAL